MTDRRTSGSRRLKICLHLATAIVALAPAVCFAQEVDLAKGFKEPPQSARPRVWWHWMNGNVTEDGIAKDLEWMQQVGIGGVQNFDANLATPQVVNTRLIYMDPAWKKAFKFAVTEADRRGLEFAIAASPGWSETGGPWVKPEDGLKKLVWTETNIAGGRRFDGRLATPPSVTGPFQAQPFGRRGSVVATVQQEARPTLYSDIAVLAYPIAKLVAPVARPTVLGRDDKPIDGSALLDDDLSSGLDATPNGDNPARFTYVFSRARTIRSADVFVPGARGTFGLLAIEPVLEASDDGRTWRPVASIELAQVRTTISFTPVTARQFRLTLRRNLRGVDTTRDVAKGLIRPNPTNIVAGRGTEPVRLAQFHLSGEDRVNQAEAKAGFSLAADYFKLDGPGVGEARGADPATVIDLTSRMKPDGTLDWTPPKGQWRVVRLGASLIGTTNHPATPEATGLEVDKFDGDAVRRYIDHYLGMYRETVGDGLIGKRGVRALLTDSIEVGAANWTPKMLAQFRRLRGYNPVPWMPVLTGALIGSRADSDRFLYDYRRTLADLMSSEHYGTLAKAAHEAGLLIYGEALEDNRPSLGDDMTMRSHADVPMAAMWTFSREAGGRPTYIADVRGAASVAHIYGQNLVAAESMTSAQAPWAHAPSDLRRVIDLEFAHGVNRPVIHTSVHQPVDDKLPGLSLSTYGQYFNRHESWSGAAKPWVDYLSRNSFMLQQGVNVADVAYFYGEEAPITGLYGGGPVEDAPTRYAYDFISADALASQVEVHDGRLTALSGASYRVLYLGGSSQQMTLAVLRRIAAFVDAGGTVVGNAPIGSPALTDDRAAFAALANRLWGGVAQGRGRVIAGGNIEAALASIDVAPDFTYSRRSPDSQVLFVHRRTANADIYFVNNRLNRAETVEARFRVTDKAPEIWRADTGTIVPVSYRTEGQQTVVPLEFGPEDSYFVVFRRPTASPSANIPRRSPQTVATLDRGWRVRFQPNRGAPLGTMPTSLGSFTDRTQPGVRYFSGKATYTTTFQLAARAQSHAALYLDLGQVGDLASVRVNGIPVGTAWHAPYQLDIGGAARRGRNTIEIEVVNLWVNRLIGDAQSGVKPTTWTSVPTYRADAPLRASGLIGPVKVIKFE